MLLTEMNVDDLNKLMKFRVERLLHLFSSSLPRCLIQFDPNDLLAVYCPNARIVDELLGELDELCNYAWLILGARAIALYFGPEEIVRTKTNLN